MLFLTLFLVSCVSVSVSVEDVPSVCSTAPLAAYSTCKANSSASYYQTLIGNCISCDSTTCIANEGVCFLDLDIPLGNIDFSTGSYFFKASLSCQELNDIVCGHLNMVSFVASVDQAMVQHRILALPSVLTVAMSTQQVGDGCCTLQWSWCHPQFSIW